MPVTPDSTPTLLSPDVRQGIEDLLKRPKKVTINDVARLAAVSKKTVSRIINNAPSVSEDTRALVNEIIARLHFRPDPQARGLAFRRSFLIGLIYDNPNAQYVVSMQNGILDQLKDTGHELVVHPCRQAHADFLDNIRDFIERQRLKGVILLPPIAEDRDLIGMLGELDVPFIRITALNAEGETLPPHSAEIVSLDPEGCAQASEHLAILGHSRIGFIAGNPSYPSAHARRAGFDAGLRRHGLAIAPDLDAPGDYSFDSGYKAACDLLDRPDRPSALICCNDEMAAGAYKAAYELGITIPNALSIVSFDDSHLAQRLSPGLTTVRLPTRQMAAMAAKLLLDWPSSEVGRHLFESELIIRKSSGPVPAS